MSPSLVWVPQEMEHLREAAPAGLLVEPMPADPSAAPQLSEVELLVTVSGSGSVAPLIQKMAGLRVIQTMSAGVDGIVTSVPPGVILCSARGCYTTPVAEWVAAGILAQAKAIPFFRDAQRDGRWSKHPVRSIDGMTMLVIGYGAIGAGVERRLEPFGASFLRVARHARPGVETAAALPDLVPRADCVILLLPLTAETRGMVNQAFLGLMKPGALLVNAGRGPLVDTDALLDALNRGAIHAVLDVTDPEPLPDDHPLFAAPNVLVTPHIAGGQVAAKAALNEFLLAQLRRFTAGEELQNRVTDGY